MPEFEKTQSNPYTVEHEARESLFRDEHEHIVDIESPEIRGRIKESRELFESFFKKYSETFDLGDSAKMQEVFTAAEREGIFSKAKEIRELIYDKNISVYGVCYLSNQCDQNCKFCPMGQLNYRKWQDEYYLAQVQAQLDKATADGQHSREEFAEGLVEEELHQEIGELGSRFRTLSKDEVKSDIEALVSIGHQEVCILSGEEISCNPLKVAEYTQAALNIPGIKEVILNMGAYDQRMFEFILNNLDMPDGVRLQHRVFQETYDREVYDYYMERSGPKQQKPNAMGVTSKRDYDHRYNSQVAAIRAGFDEVGIGALFGLTRHPMKEILGLQQHSDYIKEQTNKEPKRCCLPFANNPEKDYPVEISFSVPNMADSKKIIELVYALARLAMPTVSIVSSERDNPETLKILDQYANHTTLFVHPAPMENQRSIIELQDSDSESRIKPVGQAEVHPRTPSQAIDDWTARGYRVSGFDTKKYQSSHRR